MKLSIEKSKKKKTTTLEDFDLHQKVDDVKEGEDLSLRGFLPKFEKLKWADDPNIVNMTGPNSELILKKGFDASGNPTEENKYILLELCNSSGSTKFVVARPYDGKGVIKLQHYQIYNDFVAKREVQDDEKRLRSKIIKKVDANAPKVSVKGGGYLRIREDGTLQIYGESEAFGSADKSVVKKILEKDFPAIRIIG
jgi:hypothetical protein